MSKKVKKCPLGPLMPEAAAWKEWCMAVKAVSTAQAQEKIAYEKWQATPPDILVGRRA